MNRPKAIIGAARMGCFKKQYLQPPASSLQPIAAPALFRQNGLSTNLGAAMTFQSVRDLDVKGHRVFLRADRNVPLKDGKVTDATRIQETLPTLQCLLDGGASVVLASHLGRPEGKGFEAAYSAAPVAAWLKAQGFDCRLASYVNGPAVEAEAAALKPGQVLLLENLRFEKGETKNDPDFAASLARLADTYVDR